MSEIAPGWYKDPADPTTQRYWDGEVWIGEPLPVDATPPPGPPAGTASVPTRAPNDGRTTGAAPGGITAPGAITAPPPHGQPTSQPPPGQPSHTPPTGQPPVAPPNGQAPPGWPPPGWPPAGQPPPGQPGWPPAPGRPGWPAPPGQQGWPAGRGAPGAPPGWPGGFPPIAGLPVPRPHGMALAPLSRRFAARLIDIALVGVLSAVLTSYLAYQWWLETADYWRQVWQVAQATTKGSHVPTVSPTLSARGNWLLLAIMLLIMAIWLAYEVPNIASSGQTPGKRLMRIRVVGLEATTPIGIRRAIRRWVPLGFPLAFWGCGPFGVIVGALLQFYDCVSPTINRPLQLARHDRTAFTVVVRVGTGPADGAGADGMTNSGATSGRPGNRDTPAGGAR